MRSTTAPGSIYSVAMLCGIALLLGAPTEGRAGSHLWRFSEFYSSPDGTIQFIEMVETGDPPSSIENKIGNHWYQTNTYNLDHSELLGSDLVGDTAGKTFLVGSQSYAALPGVPAPDYVIPDGVVDPSGDTVVWWFYETIVIPAGVMPTDGVHSAVVVAPGASTQTFTVAVNSPTNFAGTTGRARLPPRVPALGSAGRALLLVSIGLLAALLWWRRPQAAQSGSG